MKVLPNITTLSFTSGPVGTVVTISGTTLTGATVVKFSTTNAASLTVNASTQITVVVAAGTTTGKVTVTTPSSTRLTGNTFTVTAAVASTITSFTPASGLVGTSVTITGMGFTGATVVKFNATNAASFTVVSPTQIVAVVAAGTTTGKVIVTTPSGSRLSLTNFTITAIRPAAVLAPPLPAWTLYPNPAHGTVQISAPREGQLVELLDGTGRVVRQINASSLEPEPFTLNLTGLRPGVYVVRCGAATARLLIH